MKCNTAAVSYLIIETLEDKKIKYTPLSLIKLIILVHSFSLSILEKPLINEPIICLENNRSKGPSIYSLHALFSRLRKENNKIPMDLLKEPGFSFCDKTKELLDMVLKNIYTSDSLAFTSFINTNFENIKVNILGQYDNSDIADYFRQFN